MDPLGDEIVPCLEDVNVDECQPDKVFNNEELLLANSQMPFLKFGLTGSCDIRSATLRIYLPSTSDITGVQLYATQETDWFEETLTWNNKQSNLTPVGCTDSKKIILEYIASERSYFEWDVTPWPHENKDDYPTVNRILS